MTLDTPSVLGFLLGVAVALTVATVASGAILLSVGSTAGAAVIIGGVGIYLVLLSYRI